GLAPPRIGRLENKIGAPTEAGRLVGAVFIVSAPSSALRRRRSAMISFLRGRGVTTRTGLSRTTIWRLVKAKKFPKPVPMTDDGYAVGWVESEVEAWMQARIEQRNQREAPLPVVYPRHARAHKARSRTKAGAA